MLKSERPKIPETAGQVRNMHGDQLYQQRARAVLPILVRQAASRAQIFYEHLAAEVNMPNPRNLNWVLGSVGITLEELSRQQAWRGWPIPPIQSLVVNQAHGLPGHGFDGFLRQKTAEYQSLSNAQKRRYLQSFWNDVFDFPYWPEVLTELGLEQQSPQIEHLIDRAKTGRSGGGGEGPEHLALKLYIRDNPLAAGVTGQPSIGEIESPLPSGDRLDVLFRRGSDLIAVEVKSKISNHVDIVRGLFQCVKYRAVMEAERGAMSRDYKIDTALVLGRRFPRELDALRNSLRVTVFEVIL